MAGRFEIISYQTISCRCGQEICTSVTVKNVGDSEANYHISIVDGQGNTLWSSYASSLAPGESRTHTIGACYVGYGDGRCSCSAPIKVQVYNETTHTVDDEKTIASSVSGNCTYGLTFDVYTDKTQYQPGEEVNVTLVMNGTDCCTNGNIDILDSNGNVVASGSTPHPVCPNENLNVPFSFDAPEEPGTYTYTVRVTDEKGHVNEKQFSIEVVGTNAPFFKIESVESPYGVECGSSFTVNVYVKNTGGSDGRVRVEIQSGGEVVGSSECDIASGNSAKCGVSVTAPDNFNGTWYLQAKTFNETTNSYDDSRDFSVYVSCNVAMFTIEELKVEYSCSESNTSILVKVKNTGQKGGNARVELYRGSTKIAENVSYIAAGNSHEFRFVVESVHEPGDYSYSVKVYNIDTGEYNDSRDFTVKTVKCSGALRITRCPDEVSVNAGSEVSINVSIENTIIYSIDAGVYVYDSRGNTVEYENIVVPANSSVNVVLKFKAPSSPGRYTYTVKVYNKYVDSFDDSRDVTVNVSGGFVKIGNIIGIIIIVIAIIVAISLLGKRRE